MSGWLARFRRHAAFLAVTMLLACSVPVAVASSASAATNPFGGVDCSKASDAAVCKTTGGDPVAGKSGVLGKITTFIALIAGVAALIMLVWGGITYIASSGDAEQTSRAKKTIIYALVGLVVIAAGQAIINLVLSKV